MEEECERKFDDVSISEHIVELQKRVTDLEILVNNMHSFIKNQIQINDFFKNIVDEKFTKEELLDIYNKHKNNEKDEKSTEN